MLFPVKNGSRVHGLLIWIVKLAWYDIENEHIYCSVTDEDAILEQAP